MRALRALARGHDAGAAAVEMAIIFPLLALLTFGVIDVGRILFTNIAIQGAAQEGAMYGSFVPDPGAVRQRVMESLDSPRLGPGAVAVSCPTPEKIKVTITHDLELLTPFLSGSFGGTVTLTRAVSGHVFSEATCGGGP